MKIRTRIISVLLVVVMALGTMCGCTVQKAEVQENVIRIRVYNAGYGTDHLNAIISEFEKLYADKGYKVVIDKANKTYTLPAAATEMSVGFEENMIDMYYVQQASSDLMVEELKDNDTLNVLDLTEVLSSKAIAQDGSEEEKTLIEKMIPGLWDGMKMDLSYAQTKDEDYKNYEGKNYVAPFHSQFSGFIVNTEKMEQAGLEMPKTTDELLNCVNVINKKRESGDANFKTTYPVSWSGGEAYNYWRAVYDVWYAQYEGVDAYNEFHTLNSYKDNFKQAYEVYEKQGWKEVYELMAVMVNDSNAPADTLTMDAVSAQDRLLVGKSVFSPCGTWVKAEMGAEYLEDMAHCEMLRVPVVSALGVKLGLDGKKGSDKALCEKVLSATIGLVDERKSADDIIAEISNSFGVTLTKEQIVAVQEARGVYGEDLSFGWIIAGDSPSTEICKLFLRFLANDYSTGVMMDLASVVSAYSNGYKFAEQGDVFDDSVIALYNLESLSPISRKTNKTTVRVVNGFSLYDNVEWEPNFGRLVSTSDMTGSRFYKQQLEYAKEYIADFKE